MRFNRPLSLLLLLNLTFSTNLFSQDIVSLKGKIIGSENAALEYVSISVLEKKDSLYVNSAITEINGDELKIHFKENDWWK